MAPGAIENMEVGVSPPANLRVPLRVVFYKEDGDWIAHCLEFDLLGDHFATRAELAGSDGVVEVHEDFAEIENDGGRAGCFV